MINLPNIHEFYKVYAELKYNSPLTLSMIGRIFGTPFWELMIIALTNGNNIHTIPFEEIKEQIKKEILEELRKELK